MVIEGDNWKLIPCKIDTTTKQAIIKTMHFSKYSIQYPDNYAKIFHDYSGNFSGVFLSVPYYNQGQSGWCQFYSTAMIAKYAGYDYQGPNFAALMNKSIESGIRIMTDWWGFDKNLNNNGIKTEVVSPGWTNTDNLCGYIIEKLRDGKPVLVVNDENSHAFVVIGYDNNGFYINDPSGVIMEIFAPVIRSDLSAMFISYDNFRKIMTNFLDYLYLSPEQTVVITSKGVNKSYGISFSFPNNMSTFVITSNDLKTKVGELVLDGRVNSNGYSIINSTNGTNSFKGSDYFFISPIFAYTHLNSPNDVSLPFTFKTKIDNENFIGSKNLSFKVNNGFYFPFVVSFQLKGLKIGGHKLKLELWDESSAILYDSWSFDFAISESYNPINSTFTDSRDNNVYETVTIGNQTWMAENLAYLPSVNPASTYSATTPLYYVYDYMGYDANEAKKTLNYQKNGVLYNWEAAKTACPSGWHLPSNSDWDELCNYISQTMGPYSDYGHKWQEIGGILKSKSGWIETEYGANGNGTDEVNFNGIPSGVMAPNSTRFNSLGSNLYMWTSNEDNTANAWCRWMNFWDSGLLKGPAVKEFGFSIRCVKNK